MARDGKRLEELVAYVERVHVPEGFSVQTNTDVRDEDGTPIAEFDIDIRGVLGTTEIAWLIECRDRPSAGPAPASWIEQLVGRRVRFNLNRVTAVSTTGFTKPAVDLATDQDIELRRVDALTPEAFSDWLQIQHISVLKPLIDYTGGSVRLEPTSETTDTLKAALSDVLRTSHGLTPLLVPSNGGPPISIAQAIDFGIKGNPHTVAPVTPGAQPKPVRIRFRFQDPKQRYSVQTSLGPVEIENIYFVGKYAITETRVPIRETTQYSHLTSGKPIAQIATFEVEANKLQLSLELHRIEKTGETHMLVRKVGSSTNDENER